MKKGEMNESSEKYKEALHYYKEAKKVFPDHPGVDESIARVEKKIVEKEQKEKAMGVIKDIFKTIPPTPPRRR